ncbi:MAG TPA: hypothetical protein VGY99_06005 [Candidatus Binataceae bacterium]|nr:hypothetical protein [Candidatus Binataceae bacterium]
MNGKQYLVRSLDRLGHIRSLGARSRQTEAIRREFMDRKKDLKTRMALTAAELRRRAKFCVAAGVNRLPTLSANIVRVLDRAGLLGPHLLVLGSHALYASKRQPAYNSRPVSFKPRVSTRCLIPAPL